MTSHRYSRTKLEEFVRCQQCFWLQEKKGLRKPSTPGYTLNNAVDILLKKEFDIARSRQAMPTIPCLAPYTNIIPLQTHLLEDWRNPKKGLRRVYQYHDMEVELYGAIDDVWYHQDTGNIHIVDYKSTARSEHIDGLCPVGTYHDVYRRQMEIYQWIAQAYGYTVDPIGYFLFANAQVGARSFDGKLQFRMSLVEYHGDTTWVEDALVQMLSCLHNEEMPTQTPACEWCQYRQHYIHTLAP